MCDDICAAIYSNTVCDIICSYINIRVSYRGGAVHVEYCGFESQLIFLRKSDCLGGAVLLCFVCLFDLACFFFSSSLEHV